MISCSTQKLSVQKKKTKELTPLALSLMSADPENRPLLEEQLSFIDADCGYEKWRNIIWSLQSTGFLFAVEVARAWSESAPDRFEEKAFMTVVESFDSAKGITLGTVIHHAKEAGWEPKANVFKNEHNRFNFLTSAELQNLPALKWRIKNVLPERGLASIYGQSGSGKTFLVLDLLARIATGEDYFGHKVNPCPVTYVALEGKGGIRKRVQAWEQHHAKKLPSSFRIILDQLSLFNSDAAVFAEAVKAMNLNDGVIVIDTLNQSAPEADENMSKDMGIILANAQLLQRLTGCLVILIHHTGKDASRGLRGHSSLLAALDVAIEVKGLEGVREWRISKSKDSDGSQKYSFELRQVPLGVDEDGDPVDSCVVKIASTLFAPAPEPKGKNQITVLNALKQLMGNSKTLSISETEKVAINTLEGIADKHRKARAREALEGLVKNGNLTKTSEAYRLVGGAE